MQINVEASHHVLDSWPLCPRLTFSGIRSILGLDTWGSQLFSSMFCVRSELGPKLDKKMWLIALGGIMNWRRGRGGLNGRNLDEGVFFSILLLVWCKRGALGSGMLRGQFQNPQRSFMNSNPLFPSSAGITSVLPKLLLLVAPTMKLG